MTRPEIYIQVFIGDVSEDFTSEQGLELQKAILGGQEWWFGENAYGGAVSIRCSHVTYLGESTPETRVAYHDSLIEARDAVKAMSVHPGEECGG